MGRDCRWLRGEASEPRRRAQHRGAEGKAERFPHRGSVPTSTHQPKRGLSAHPLGWAGLGAEARASVGSQGEDWGWRHEHSLKGLVHHSWPGGSPGKSLQLRKRQETFSSLFVSWCARRGDSERCLNELQRRAQATAISAEPTETGAQRKKRRDSRTEDRCRPALTSPREACLLSRRGGWGWELRLGLRSDRRERTGVGGVNTA